MTNLEQASRMSVVYISDEKYAMPTCISLLSLKENIKPESVVTVYLICDKVTEDSQDKFLLLEDERFTINIINVDNPEYIKLAKSCGSFGQNHVTATALFKMNLCEILSEEDKVLYLDGDTLIQGEVEELYHTEFDGKYIAAVDDQLDEMIDGKSKMAAKVDINAEHYFNSGVMLLNLKKMREDNVCDKLIEYRENGKNYFMDQDAFNAVMRDGRIVLPYRYNFISTCIEYYDAHEISERFLDGKQNSVEACIYMAKIIHFAGRYKPWQYNLPWFSELFLHYYTQSPYAEEKIRLKSVTKAMQDDINGLLNALCVADKYIFPYDKIAKNERIILYGAGKIGRLYYSQIMATQYCEVAGWVDSNYMNYDEPVKAPEVINEIEFSKILICIGSENISEEVRQFLIEMYHINVKNIIII